MSHPFPLEVETNHRRSAALNYARQERLAQVAATRAAAGQPRTGRKLVGIVTSRLNASATHLVLSLRAFRTKVDHSRGAI